MANKNEKLNFDLDFLGSDNIEKELSEKPSFVNQTNSKEVTEQENIEQSNIKENKTENNNENKKDLSTKNTPEISNKNNFQEEPDGCLISIIITLVISVLIISLTIWSENIEKKKQLKIQQTTSLAYNYKIECNPLFEETVDKISKLTNKSSEEIKRELQQKFDTEKEQCILGFVNNYIETGLIDDKKAVDYQKRFFNNDTVEFEKSVKECFFKRHEEISKQLLQDWKNKSENYEKNKQKYLKTLFDNDINLFNQTMDALLGYKYFALKKQDLPKTGIMNLYSPLPAIAPFKISTSQPYSYSYNSYNYSSDDKEHYYIKLVDYYTNKTVATIFIRAGENTKVEVPTGSYKIKYATGKTWYGEADLFGHETHYSTSDERLDFSVSYGYVNGQQLTLYKVSNGNFSTKEIKAEDF